MQINFTEPQKNWLKDTSDKLLVLVQKTPNVTFDMKKKAVRIQRKFGPGCHTVFLKREEKDFLLMLANGRLEALIKSNPIHADIEVIQSIVEALEK